jgi:hypothetical protein
MRRSQHKVLTYHVVSGHVLKADVPVGTPITTVETGSFTVNAQLNITDARARFLVIGSPERGSCATYSGLWPGCSSCLTSQATRLGRPLVTNTLEAVTNTSTVDATKIFDYSYRQIFTPDYRGNSGAQGGSATDFGLDTVTESYALTAVPAANSGVKVCNWNIDATAGVLTRTLCTTRNLAGLTPAAGAIPRRVGIATLSTFNAEGDYVVGRITAGALQLKLWRVGQK